MSPTLTQELSVTRGWVPDLEKSVAVQHFNVYFTHHYIPMDLKPWTTITTVVTVNILTSVMSSSRDGQKSGSAVRPRKGLNVCVWGRETEKEWGLLIATVTAAMAAVVRNRRVIELLWCHQFGEASRWAGPGTEPALNKHIQINTCLPTNTNNHIMLFQLTPGHVRTRARAHTRTQILSKCTFSYA